MDIQSLVTTVFATVFTLAMLISSIKIVNQQTVAITSLFGKYRRTLDAGFHFLIPFFEKTVTTIGLEVFEIRADVEIKTEDNMFVKLPVNLMLQIKSESAADAYYQLRNPREQISSWTLNSLRSVAASMTLKDLFHDREKITKEIQSELSTRLAGYGYYIVGVLVDQPTIPESVQASFNRVVASEREKRRPPRRLRLKNPNSRRG